MNALKSANETGKEMSEFVEYAGRKRGIYNF